MWKNIYDLLLQKLTTPWAEFIQKYSSCGRNVRDKFFSDVYSLSGLWLILISIIICCFFYFYLNGRFGKYYSKKSYFFTMFINSSLITIATFVTGRIILHDFICPTTTRILWLSIINFFYGIIWFLFVSACIKWKSYMGKRTPF
jgi:uncharacterized membrane protein